LQKINQYAKKATFYFHFDIFIFENKVAMAKMQLNGQFALCLTAMECPALPSLFLNIVI
jgi:hypothetical protein